MLKFFQIYLKDCAFFTSTHFQAQPKKTARSFFKPQAVLAIIVFLEGLLPEIYFPSIHADFIF